MTGLESSGISSLTCLAMDKWTRLAGMEGLAQLGLLIDMSTCVLSKRFGPYPKMATSANQTSYLIAQGNKRL